MSPPTVFVGVAVEEPEMSVSVPAVPEEEATDKAMEPAVPAPVLSVAPPVLRKMLPDLLPVAIPVLSFKSPVIVLSVVEREIAPDVPVGAAVPL
jgi:hypothetical protein